MVIRSKRFDCSDGGVVPDDGSNSNLGVLTDKYLRERPNNFWHEKKSSGQCKVIDQTYADTPSPSKVLDLAT
jgi:hypothetical protein